MSIQFEARAPATAAHPIAPNGMPLHCFICPKRPDFSDESHLLTHVGSKGHLSHYYKLKVAAGAESAARESVDSYDRWYTTWGVEQLMRDRMAQKEKRKTAGGGSGSRRSGSVATAASSRSTPNPAVLDPFSKPAPDMRAALLDPQLDRVIIKQEFDPFPEPVAPLFQFESHSYHRVLPPSMNSWPVTPTNQARSRPLRRLRSDGYDDDDDEGDDAVPCSEQSRRLRRQITHRGPTTETASLLLNEVAEVDELANDESKLKGVIWPGMDCFDSATPEMKRKRNQKKTTSILHQLMTTSSVVEPTELIFDTAGTFQKARDIDGNPELPDSPLRGETTPEPDTPPPPKKKTGRRARQPRQALAEKNPNNGRALRRNGKNRQHSTFGGLHGPYFGGPDGSDNDTTYGCQKKKKKFGIRRDANGPDITFNQPAPMDYLTSTFDNPFENPFERHDTLQRSDSNASLFTQQPLEQGYGHHTRPSLSGFRPTGSDANIWGNGGTRDLSAFGGLTAQSLFSQPGTALGNLSAIQDGHGAFDAFQQHFAPMDFGHIPTTQSGLLSTQSEADADQINQALPNWDMFGIGAQFDGLADTNAADGSRQNEPDAIGELGILNPLFDHLAQQMGSPTGFGEEFTANPLQEHPVADDDDGTVSAPNSAGHSPRPGA